MKIKSFTIKVEVKKRNPYAKLQTAHANKKKAYNRQKFKREFE